ncbi:WhiB family transcriptional regulator [Corynebacterium oculi]|uniref:Transcriptional regulator WhiB n=1 Tax=Corynebacterium oculi TaxID=1544416 RepID=A0A0Q0U026_9CORY|nr:Transcriptional regulator WhiB [Corynebacterium oculi]
MVVPADYVVPEWHERALCARAKNPKLWDEPGPGNEPRWVKLVRAVELCQDCPVAALCAAEGLAHKDVGVIRGGVTLPGSGMTGSTRRSVRAALRAVAEGDSPAKAVLDVYARLKGYEKAREALVALIGRRGPSGPGGAPGGSRAPGGGRGPGRAVGVAGG